MAKQYQTILWEAMDPSKAYENTISMGLHIECLVFLDSDNFYTTSSLLKAEIINTQDRMAVYQSFDNRLAGEIFPTSQLIDYNHSCIFQLN